MRAAVIVDPVGGGRFADSLRSLAPEGRLLVLGFTGREIPTVRVNRLLHGRVPVAGARLPRPAMARDDVSAALQLLDERQATGKVLIRMR